jgi:hypothetical protein
MSYCGSETCAALYTFAATLDVAPLKPTLLSSRGMKLS